MSLLPFAELMMHRYPNCIFVVSCCVGQRAEGSHILADGFGRVAATSMGRLSFVTGVSHRKHGWIVEQQALVLRVCALATQYPLW